MPVVTATSTLASALRSESRSCRRAVAAGVFVSFSSIGLAGTSAWLIVRAAQRPAILSLTFVMGLVQLFALSKAAGRYLERMQTHDSALAVMGRVRSRVARVLEPLIPAGLGPRSDEVVDVALRDVERVQNLLTVVAGPLVASSLAALATLVVSGLVVPASAAVLSAGLVLSVGVLPTLGARWGRRSEAELDCVRRLTVGLYARAALSGDEYVMTGADEALFEELEDLEKRADRALLRGAWARAAVSSLLTLVAGSTALTVALVTAKALVDHDLSRALLAVPTLLSVAVLELVGGVAPTMVGLFGDREALARIDQLSQRVPPVREPSLTHARVLEGDEVTLEDVGVRFGGVHVLSELSLQLTPGSYTVMRGPSGAGKTTLARVIAKFLDPSSGRLALSSTDYRQLTSAQVRNHVGFVDDAPYVFATSLAGNLRIARPDATDEELRDALRDAGLSTLLEGATEDLATPLGGEGDRLSGGERRRLGVARELLVSRNVVVFDEPTEGLDGAQADELRRTISSRYHDAAVLIISHLPGEELVATREIQLIDGKVIQETPPRAEVSPVGSNVM